MSKYLALDLETGSQTYLGRKGSFLKNEIVAIGIKPEGQGAQAWCWVEGHCTLPNFAPNNVGLYLLVGHNIKFDLLYLWNVPQFQKWLSLGGKIWDTQLAEYILSGQRHKYSALREIAVNKYGCKERKKRMEEYWDKGIDTKDIPKELVLEDVMNDVLDTEAIMLQQVKTAKKEKMYDLIMEQMDGLLATCEMEWNGLYCEQKTMSLGKELISKELDGIYKELEVLSEKYYK